MYRIITPVFMGTLLGAGLLAGLPAGARAECDLSRDDNLLAEDAITHFRVIFGKKPDRKALVSWSTGDDAGSHMLHYGTAPGDYDNSVQAISGEYKGDKGDFYHHAQLVGLDADTRYYFRIESNGALTDEMSFTTAPDRDDDEARFKLLVGGDSRTDDDVDDFGEEDDFADGSSAGRCYDHDPSTVEIEPDPITGLYGRRCRQEMNGLMADLFAEHPDIVALSHGGDYIMTGGSWKQWCAWLEDHQETTVDGRLLPLLPTRGNHESHEGMYTAVFGDPDLADLKSAPRDVVVSRFGGFALVTLDSEASISAVADTLEDELDAMAGNMPRWLAASYHEPAFPTAKGRSGRADKILDEWVPQFEDAGFDVVFESDGHAYKRSEPRASGGSVERSHEDGGVYYIGEGGLGAPIRESNSRGYLEKHGSFRHVMIVRIHPERLVVKVKRVDDDTVDELRLTPRPR